MRYADNSFVSDPGDPIEIQYSPKVNKDGSFELVETGKINTDDMIQSYKESTDIRVILSRCAQGDFSALNVKKPMYGNFLDMPKTYAEALQLRIDSENLFYSLPVDVRQKFDNDADKFFASSGTQEWYDNIKGVLPDDVKDLIYPVDVKKVESPENGDKGEE